MKNLFKFWENKLFRQVSYFLLIILIILFLGRLGHKFYNIEQFFEAYELKTYDLRLNMAGKEKQVNPNIIIVSIDNVSLEVLQEELGRWPWSRDVYAKIINYLNKNDAAILNFDLKFVGAQKGFENKDNELANAIKKYDNAYVSMDFDNISDEDIRTNNAPDLPDILKANLENHSKSINFENSNFNYCNLILESLIKNTKNIGIINFMRDDDGVSRRSPTFFKYKDNYYPYMPLKLASDYIAKNEKIKIDKYVINEKNQLIFGNKIIQLDDQGFMIINWNDIENKFINVPFWKIYKSMENEKKGLPPVQPLEKGDFKNKIIFIGATATSLYDIKTTPVNRVYPGVEIQATVFNNIMKNNFIKRMGSAVNLGICILLGILIAITVIKINEPFISTLISIGILASYIIFASIMLNQYNLWFDILPQFIFVILTFTFMFIVKYLLKSKDFEYTYRLATTDGLTNLYNHRYFQEHLAKCMEKANKNNTRFAVILIDIDFFKKFNDTYGHQAGDEVLRQVGQTLRKAVKSNDLVARYGGEEMVIVVDKVHTEAAMKVANRICKRVADKKFELSDGVSVNVTISLGVSTYPIDGKTSTELIEFADQGLYRAKHNGRNQVGSLPEIKIITAE